MSQFEATSCGNVAEFRRILVLWMQATPDSNYSNLAQREKANKEIGRGPHGHRAVKLTLSQLELVPLYFDHHELQNQPKVDKSAFHQRAFF